ncbi:DNA topoisomerase family protein [Vibrio viridaestus]|uniref:DNA topoisomerase n=1 Tax=Vibrio viridaestus TaxID=2487322 RepID=A0A3N9TAX2_9VIBR|nr:topoisomerase DNA-binding C4 zinc finger domain-containing protein [Vibrio viridaestus]RQW61291.1 DNA topoisomerase [Vibrio viridaestus]
MSKKQIDKTLFSAHEHALDTRSDCPKCGGKLEMRYGKRGAFLGCINYPSCDFMQPLHQNDGHIIKQLGVACPECGNELVLRQGKYGMFIGCSHYPECHHIEPLESKEEKSSNQESHVCPECGKGHLVERKSRFGKQFWACDQYPKCKFALNFMPKTGQCELCGFPLLYEKKLASGTKVVCANRKCGHVQEVEQDLDDKE